LPLKKCITCHLFRVRASHRKFGQIDFITTPQDGSFRHQELQLLGQETQDVVYQDYSTFNDFDIQLLYQHSPYGLCEQNNSNQPNIIELTSSVNEPNNFVEQRLFNQSDQQETIEHYINQPNTLNVTSQSNNQEQFLTFEQSDPAISFDLTILQPDSSTVDIHPSVPVQTKHESKSLARRTNAKKCKEFRERKKEKKINLIEELEREEQKNTSLKMKTKYLENRVAKFKKIILKNAESQKSDLSLEYILSILDC